MKILFVCFGNTCRSPMAEIIFSNIAKKNNRRDITVKSAGIYAEENQPMMPLAREALMKCGEKLPRKIHKSTRLTMEMQHSFDHVIDTRAYLDPFGGDLEDYVTLCKQLQTACQMLYDKLCKTSSSPATTAASNLNNQ